MADLDRMEATARAADKVAPGGWDEDSLVNNHDGRRYRDSQIIAWNPRKPDDVISLMDTLNAHHTLDEDERFALGTHIATFDPPTVLALIAALREARAAYSSAAEVAHIMRDRAARAEAEAARMRDVIMAVKSELINLQPHIPQACYPGHQPFIDTHIDKALKIANAALEPTK